MRKILLMMLILIILNGCGQLNTENQPALSSDDEIKVAVLIYRYNDRFISIMKDEIEREINELEHTTGETIKLDFFDAQNQQNIQTAQLMECIDDAYDVIVVNIVDLTYSSNLINLASDAEIPLVFFNREPSVEDILKWDQVYYVGADDRQSGIMQGEMILDYWNNHDIDINEDGIIQYVILEGESTHQATLQRSEYVIKTITESDILVAKLASYNANWQKDQASEKMEAWLDAFGSKIELVIANNDEMAIGAGETITEFGYSIPIFGVDGTNEALAAIDSKVITGTILNDAVSQANGVVEISYQLALGLDPTTNLNNFEKGRYYYVPYKKIR